MRKLLSVALVTLAFGAGTTRRAAEAGSYCGAAARCCPAEVECGGHVRYELRRCTVLRPVQETIYEARQVPVVREVCETVMQPRTVTTYATCAETCYQEVPYTVQ